MITIVDYGMGNLNSISNMLKKTGFNSKITSRVNEIKEAKKLILPGVGSFDRAIKNIEKLNLTKILNEKVLDQKIPVLGICLGMQLMTKSSEEGKLRGFGWIDAETIKFTDNSLKFPHMGWNSIKIKNSSPLFCDTNQERRFYFIHNYYVKCNLKENILATTNYGLDFTSIVHKKNIFGTQFHPEKSHSYGMEILENFSKY